MLPRQLTLDGGTADPASVVRQTERPRAIPLSQRPNPMLAVYGEYRDGTRGGAQRVCGDCVHLVWKGGHGSHRYYGCRQRGQLTNGPATDHLVRWTACTLF